MLEFKLESLRARGELSTEERDRLLSALKGSPAPEKRRVRWLTPLRAFLLGFAAGVTICYLLWPRFG